MNLVKFHKNEPKQPLQIKGLHNPVILFCIQKKRQPLKRLS